jgi:hypothetical protein
MPLFHQVITIILHTTDIGYVNFDFFSYMPANVFYMRFQFLNQLSFISTTTSKVGGVKGLFIIKSHSDLPCLKLHTHSQQLQLERSSAQQ